MAKRKQELFNKIFGDFIVAVDKTNIFTGGNLNTMIPCGGLTSVFLMDELNSGVFHCIRFGDLIGIVGRAIVY